MPQKLSRRNAIVIFFESSGVAWIAYYYIAVRVDSRGNGGPLRLTREFGFRDRSQRALHRGRRRLEHIGSALYQQVGNCALDLGFFGRSYRPQVQGDAIVQYSRDHGRLAAPEPRGDFFSVKRRMFQADKGGGQRRQWRSPSADNRLFLNQIEADAIPQPAVDPVRKRLRARQNLF